jgi:hypothetical protein
MSKEKDSGKPLYKFKTQASTNYSK